MVLYHYVGGTKIVLRYLAVAGMVSFNSTKSTHLSHILHASFCFISFVMDVYFILNPIIIYCRYCHVLGLVFTALFWPDYDISWA